MVSFIQNMKPSKWDSGYTSRGWKRINYPSRRSRMIVPQMQCYHAFEIPARISRTSKIECLTNAAEEGLEINVISVGKIISILGTRSVRLFAPRPKTVEIYGGFSLEIPPPPLSEDIFVYAPGDALLWAMHLIEDNHVKPFNENEDYKEYLGLLKSEQPVPSSPDPDMNTTPKGYFNWRSRTRNNVGQNIYVV